MFLSSLRKSCQFFPSSVKSGVVPLSLSFALETVCWNKATTRFWSYSNVTQMGASLLVTATLMSTQWLSSVTIREQVRIGYTSRKQATVCSPGSFIIFRWGCQPLGTLKQQACGDQSHGGCPVVWDFQWSGLADVEGVVLLISPICLTSLFSIVVQMKNNNKRSGINSTCFLSVSTIWKSGSWVYVFVCVHVHVKIEGQAGPQRRDSRNWRLQNGKGI